MQTQSIIKILAALILVSVLFVYVTEKETIVTPPEPEPTPTIPDEIDLFEAVNDHGKDATYSTLGAFDLSNPFFQDLGSNGRTCLTCHVPSE